MPRKISGIDKPARSMSSLGQEPVGSTLSNAEEPTPSGNSFEGFPLPDGVVINTPDANVQLEDPAEKVDPDNTKLSETEDKAKSETSDTEVLEDLTRTPREYWEEDLKALGMTISEAEHILDQVMTTGLYFETYKVGGSVLKLRTRTTSDADRLMEILQDQKPETTGVYSHLVTRVNLAASLVQYGKRTFKHTTPTDDSRERVDYEWRERYRFCAALPAPAFYTISQILQKFDEKVTLACDARSVENF